MKFPKKKNLQTQKTYQWLASLGVRTEGKHAQGNFGGLMKMGCDNVGGTTL